MTQCSPVHQGINARLSDLPNGVGSVMAFEAGGVICCLPLEEVERVLLLPATDPLPGSPPWVVGLLNLRSDSVPVVDLAMRMGILNDEPYSLDMTLMLCRHGSTVGGLLVERVLGVYEAAGLKAIDVSLPSKAYPLLHSVVRADSLSMYMIELEEA